MDDDTTSSFQMFVIMGADSLTANFRSLGGIPPCAPFFYELSKLICLYMVSVETIWKEKLWSIVTLFWMVNIDGWLLYFSIAIWTGSDRWVVESNRSSLEDKFKLSTAFLKSSLNFSAISRSSEKVLLSLTNVIYSVVLSLSLRKGFMFCQNVLLSLNYFKWRFE